MAVKTILLHSAARRRMLRGVEILAKTVAVTLGPRGRNVLLDKSRYHPPVVTKDGVTVAKEIELSDRFENMGAQMVKEVATKTSVDAGDGTTTATVIAHRIFAEGMKLLAAGHDPIDLKRGIDRAVDAAVEELKRLSRPVRGSNDIRLVATVSANGDETVGEMVARAMEKVGKEGVVAVEEGRGLETTVEVIEGMDFDRGYISPSFATDPVTQRVLLENCFVLLHAKPITSMAELVPLLEGIGQVGRSLLIIAENVEGEALAALVVNKRRGVLKCAAVRTPGFGEKREALMEDIAIVTGTRVVSEATGLSLKTIKPSDLGRAKKVFIDRANTTIIGGAGKKKEIVARADRIRKQIAEAANDYDREKLEERLAKLAGGVAIIRAGGFTEIDMKERKARLDDAVCAARAATEEGILPGGGVALVRAAEALGHLDVPSEQQPGVGIIRRALEDPLRWIASNAGWDPAVVIERIRSSRGALSLNAATGRIEDLMKAGIVDPTKVVQTALQNAASIAGVALMTETAIAEKPDVPEKGYLDPPTPATFK